MKTIFTICSILCFLISSYVHACDVKGVSKYEYKAMLQDWLGCKSKPKNDEIAKYWSDFGFEKVTWDEGRGWENWCDERLPLGKTFASIKLLKDGWNIRATNTKSTLTNGSYAYAAKHIEKLSFRCSGEDVNTIKDAAGYTNYGIFGSDKTYIFKRGLSSMMELASTLIHEARHSDAHKGHVDCTKIKADDGCDRNLNDGGSHAYSIAWKINFAYHGKDTNNQERLSACNTANTDISMYINDGTSVRCNPDLIDIQLPKPTCPKTLSYSGKVESQSASAMHSQTTTYSSNPTLASSTATTCTYNVKLTTKGGAYGGTTWTSTSESKKTFKLSDLAQTYEKVLPSYLW